MLPNLGDCVIFWRQKNKKQFFEKPPEKYFNTWWSTKNLRVTFQAALEQALQFLIVAAYNDILQ